MRLPQRSMGRMRSFVPCEMKRRGLPSGVPLITKPGENATTLRNRSPLIRPSEIAYEAPSEKPPIAVRAGSIATVSKTRSKARFNETTSLPKLPPMASHVELRELGASTATPASSCVVPRYENMSSALCVAPCNITSRGTGDWSAVFGS